MCCLNMSVVEILIVHSAPSSVFLLAVCALQIVTVTVGGFSPGKYFPLLWEKPATTEFHHLAQ